MKFLDIVDRNCAYNIIADEVNVIPISNLKDITLSHKMEQSRTMLCRKLERNYIEEDFGELVRYEQQTVKTAEDSILPEFE